MGSAGLEIEAGLREIAARFESARPVANLYRDFADRHFRGHAPVRSALHSIADHVTRGLR